MDISLEKGGLNNDQRRNLGSVAKILQFAATKKGFGEESPHLVVLNPYIVECHEKFKKFFQECCMVRFQHLRSSEYIVNTVPCN